MISSVNYDSSVYYDYVYPMIFPLANDSIYSYRDSTNPEINTAVRQRFLGVDTICIPAGTFTAYKWQFLTGLTPSSNPTIFYNWIGENGLLKRFVDYGEVYVSDNAGTTARKVHLYDISELIGKNDIDKNWLQPWGK